MERSNILTRRILLADDEEFFRTMTAELFAKNGYECFQAADGIEALKVLESQSIDLLIADINMPGNENLELVQAAGEKVQGLPVVLLTAHPSINTATQSLQMPVAAYMVKPVHPRDLLETAAKCVERYRNFRTVEDSHRRLETWGRELEQIRDWLKKAPHEAAWVPLNSFLKITVDNTIATLIDLRNLMDAVAAREIQGEVYTRLVLVSAIQETIEVLEKTKNNFRSPELANLRKKLETILAQTPVAKGPGQKS